MPDDIRFIATRGGQTVVSFRDGHLQYGDDLIPDALFEGHLAYHASRGRLGLKRKD